MGDLFDPYPFAVGMLALVNPCGFALLPAYLGFFLGQQEDEAPSRVIALNRAQLVGLSMSAGFLFVFGLLGIVLAGLLESIRDALPYFSIVMGAGLVILAIAMLRGFQPTVKIPKLERGTSSTSMASMFLFGVSYAIASLSCTIHLFIGVVGTTADTATFTSRVGSFLSYGLGMGLLATALTLTVALGKRGLVNRFRSLLPRINIISSLIVLLIGPYIALYGIWELQVNDVNREPTPWIDSIIDGALQWQADLANWIDARSTVLGWTFFAVNAALVAAGVIARSQSGSSGSAQPAG